MDKQACLALEGLCWLLELWLPDQGLRLEVGWGAWRRGCVRRSWGLTWKCPKTSFFRQGGMCGAQPLAVEQLSLWGSLPRSS